MTEPTGLRIARDGAVATLTLDRPERKNALSPALVEALTEALGVLDHDTAIGAIVLEGAGGNFSAGGDLSAMDRPPAHTFADLVLALEASGTPVVAKVRGLALGGAVGLVAACTFAIAEEGARIGTPEIRRGLFPFVALRPILRVVPHRKALELFLLGETADAATACALGLVNRVVPADALDGEVETLARRLSSGPSRTISQGLRALQAQAELPEADALRLLYDELIACIASDEAQEGIRAFVEKRDPRWK